MTTLPAKLPHSLSHYLLEKPTQEIDQHNWQSRLYCVAMVVSAISALAIFGGVSALYLGLLGETALSGTATLSVLLGGGLSIHGVDTFGKWKVEEESLAKWYGKLNTRLQEVQNWKDADISAYFADHQRPLDQLEAHHKTTLQEINPQRPAKALLPLIARCRLIEHYVAKWTLKGRQQAAELANIHKHPPETQDNIRKIYEALTLRSDFEKKRHETLLTQHLNLLA